MDNTCCKKEGCTCDHNHEEIINFENELKYPLGFIDGSNYVRFAKGVMHNINGINLNTDKIIGNKLFLRCLKKNEIMNINKSETYILKSSNNVDVEFVVDEVKDKKVILRCKNVIISKNNNN